MKLLIADKLPGTHVDRLRDIADAADYEPDITAESLAMRMIGVNILIVRGTRVSAECIDSADSLELIVRRVREPKTSTWMPLRDEEST